MNSCLSEQTGRVPDANRPVGVAFLENTLVVGGAERTQQRIIRNMDRSAFRPVVCCLRDPGQVGVEIRESGVPVYHNLAKSRFDPRAILRLASIFRKENIRVLHVLNYPGPMLIGRAACRLAGVPAMVVGVHSTGYIRDAFRRKWGARLAAPFVTRFITLAESHRKYFARHAWTSPKKIVVIPVGVDVEKLNREAWPEDARQRIGVPEGAEVVGIVAMLRPEKRHDVFLKAAHAVLAKEPNAFFIIVGDGPRRQEIERMVAELGLTEKVKLTGKLDEPALAMKAFDLQVLCSDDVVETSPGCLLEASAMSLPVISTRTGSVHEQVIDGETGLLVPTGDHQALADAILKLLTDPEKARRMGEAGRELVVERFSVQTMTRQYEELFASLAEGRGQ